MKLLRWLMLVCIVGSFSLAAYVNTTIGTVVTTNTETVTLGYTVAGVEKFSNKKFLDGSQTVSVGGHGGLRWVEPAAAQTVVAGERYQIPISVINSGNFTDTVDAGLVKGARFSTDEWLSSLDLATQAIPREGVGQFVLFVTASAVAEDTEFGDLTVSINGTGAHPYGEYVGSNNYTYGGVKLLNRAITFTVSAPNIAITKSATIEAPAGWVASGGNANDPVPGAKIVYTLAFHNTGSSTANAVEVNDIIPADTELLDALGGTITCYDQDNNVVAFTPGTLASDVRAINWNLDSLDPNESGTATFTVVIK